MKESMFYGAGPIVFELAQKLSNNVTQIEMILWGMLKERFSELKFIRQHPVSIYIVDLYCHSKKLVIEMYGSILDSEESKVNETGRQIDLEG